MTADIAQQVLDLVGKQGDAEAEVTVTTGSLALTRFANSFIHQNVAEVVAQVRLRVHAQGRTAASTTTVTSADGLASLVERTLGAARLQPVDAGWAGLTEPAEPSGPGRYDPATAAADPDERAELVRAFVEAAGGLETAGSCRTAETLLHYANTTGHSLEGRATSAIFDGIARTCSSDGVARAAATSIAELRATDLGTRAAAKARAAADPVPLAPGRYPVVLDPSAVADLLFFGAYYGFNARAALEGRSFVKLGEHQFAEQLTIVDDPLHVGAIGVPIDAEGAPRRPLTLVDRGTSTALTHDRRTARAMGVGSTGHAIEGGERFGAIARHLRVAPGPTSDLLAGLDRGLLVSDLWYTRVLDPRTLVATGLTRNGVWWVENGEVVRPVRNLRFTQSYVDALAAGSVEAVGSAVERVPLATEDYIVETPALRLASWNFTGGAAT